MLEQRDRRQQVLPLQAVRIKVVGPVVRRQNEHRAEPEQRGQQPAKDHRVGDVGNVKFVEADQPVAAGDPRRHRRQRVFLARERLQLVVDAFHESMKVNAGLAPQRNGRIKGIHQEALAAADASPQVDAAWRQRRMEPASQQRQPRSAEFDQLVVQALQPVEGAQLRVVEDDPAPIEFGLEVREQRAISRRRNVGFRYGFVHERATMIMNEESQALSS